jgi:hypothetical protein
MVAVVVAEEQRHPAFRALVGQARREAMADSRTQGVADHDRLAVVAVVAGME